MDRRHGPRELARKRSASDLMSDADRASEAMRRTYAAVGANPLLRRKLVSLFL